MDNVKKLIEEYAQLAELHSSSDTFDPKSVQKSNQIAKKILKLADTISQNNGTIEFQKLLFHKNPGVRSWAAFNFIERMNPDEIAIENALRVIEELSKSDSIDAPGAELWLENWRKINGR